MRKLALIAIMMAVVLALVLAGSITTLISSGAAKGFETSSLRAPAMVIDPTAGRIYHDNSTRGVGSSSLKLGMTWTVTPIYSGYGGVMNITVTNNNPTSVYIYKFGVVWDHSTVQHMAEHIHHVVARPEQHSRLPFLPGPGQCALRILQHQIELGGPERPRYQLVDRRQLRNHFLQVCHPGVPLTYLNHSTTTNGDAYYSKVNTRVNMGVTRTIADNILINNSGVYSIQAVADAFDWVRSHIVYADDPNDYWQSSSETLSWRTGDCEDYAILLASMIDEMGGNARVNIIDGHAFPSVFVGSNASVEANVSRAISSHYGTQVPVYFLNDTTGYWMVVDPTGFPYAGGLPTLSGPVLNDPAHTWSFQSSTWLCVVDATGSTQGSSLLPF